jgi:hypothetical protein
MKSFARPLALVATLAAAAAFAPATALAAGPGGHGFGGAGHSFSGGHAGGGSWHGGRPGGAWRGGSWGHRGFWPGPFWGGIGLGLGIGAIGYYGAYPYYGYPYYGDPYYGYYYDAPEVVVTPSYDAVGPAPGARTGQAVPPATRAAEPIYYPKNGQSAATAESDRRECNRWATTQPGAMADASIFQRATFACMEGRGYTVK